MSAESSPTPLPRVLLAGLVDYAGLFPPAALPMPEAVAQYASYRAGPTAWMLGRFVVAASALDAFVDAASRLQPSPQHWLLAVLGTSSDAERITRFNAAHQGQFSIDTVECRVDGDAEAKSLRDAYDEAFTLYAELPLDDRVDDRIAALSVLGLAAKVRTGGLTAEAFPRAERLAEFLRGCARHRVPFKATAGLHHPLRGAYRLTYAADSGTGRMFGFLNVFLTAMLFAHGLSSADAIALLEEEDPTAFTVDATSIRWREYLLTAAQIAESRAQWVGSFGSCSFAEPVDELTRLRLL